MKFTIKNKNNENLINLMRKIGYLPLNGTGPEISFGRPLERSGYPRFHIYLKEGGDEIIFNLHLDQKRPVFKMAHDHAAEYEGSVLEREKERIKQLLENDD